MRKKVFVAMSGGVDSSVAAYLLKKDGYDVVGVTMQIWQDDKEESCQENSCCGISAVEDARHVADKIGIPFYVMNFKDIFRASVIDYFVAEYLRGKTPNPCIQCNRAVKWESFLNKALALGADYIATGHYAKIQEDSGRYFLKKAGRKDQTYALYSLTQEQLKKTLMPIGNYDKPVIRQIAEQIGLEVFDKPDSQEICFIEDHNHGRFIHDYTGAPQKKGLFLNKNGQVLGEHQGIGCYTIGQRKGLGIAFGKPMYVCSIDNEKNTVILGDNEDLWHKELLAEQVNFMKMPKIDGPVRAYGKIRYSHQAAKCEVIKSGEKLSVRFDEPQRAITPGQAAVFYDETGAVLFGGTIA